MLERVLLPLLPDPLPLSDPAPALLLAGYSYGTLAAASCPPPASHPTLRTRHLLVSYPLSVLWALTLFNSSTSQRALLDLVRSPTADVLAVFGDSDQFSGVGPLRKWSGALEREGALARSFRGVEVVGADHFWRAEDLGEVMQVVRDWLKN